MKSDRLLETLWAPNLDFSENEKEYIVRLEGPGRSMPRGWMPPTPKGS